jgi:hypothetical protein
MWSKGNKMSWTTKAKLSPASDVRMYLCWYVYMYTILCIYIYTYLYIFLHVNKPICREWLGKHIPAEANARNNRTFIARQRISKQASLKIKAVLSAWSLQSGYKEVFSGRKWSEDSSFGPPVCREQRNYIESSVRNWQLKNNVKKGFRPWKEDSVCDFKWQWDCFKSVSRIRLVKTENLRACVTVNCKVCRSAMVLYCL